MMKKEVKTDIKYITLMIVLVLIGLSTFILVGEKHGHDTFYHMANIESLIEKINLEGFKEGFKISDSIGGGIGYGNKIFYPILPHMFCAIMCIIFNIRASLSILISNIIVAVLSSVVVYFLSLELQKKKSVAVLSGFLYTTMPYFLSDLFIRCSLNENFVLLFFPILLLSLFKLIDNKKKAFYILFILGYVGLILSHLVMTLYATMMLIPFAIIYRKEIFIKENIKRIVIAVLTVSILVLPDIILFLQHQLTDLYIVSQEGSMTSFIKLSDAALSLSSFIKYEFPSVISEVGVLIPSCILVFVFLSSIVLIVDRKKYMNKNILYIIILTVISLIMSTKLFPWDIMPETLQLIQFPWRLSMFFILGLVLLAPICLNKIKTRKYNILTCAIIILVTVTMQYNFSFKYDRIRVSLSDLKLYKDILSYHGLGNQREYLTYKSQGHYLGRKQTVINLKNSKKIVDYKNNEFKINTDKKLKIELPKVYYLGYELIDDNNNKYDLVESKNGFIETTISKSGTYKLIYKGTLLYRIFRGIRIIFIILLPLYLVIKYKKRNNKK